MTHEPLYLLAEREVLRCRGQVEDQLREGRHPKFVTVVAGTRWGWIEGRYRDEEAAVEVRTVTVRDPAAGVLGELLLDADLRIQLPGFGPKGVPARHLRSAAFACFTFGAVFSFGARHLGVGWALALVAALVIPVLAWAGRFRRRCLRTSSDPAAALLAVQPDIAHAALWEACGDPELARALASEHQCNTEGATPGVFPMYRPETHDPQGDPA